MQRRISFSTSAALAGAIVAGACVAGMPATGYAQEYPGFYSATWYAMVAPPKTPADIATKLSSAVVEILQVPEIAGKLEAQSMVVVALPQAEAGKFIKSEVERWRDVIKAAGLKAK